MIYVKPSFYNKFKCIASKCSDNCCIGWEIDVDKESLEKYKKVKGYFGKKLIDNIEAPKESEAYFKLKKDDRCPFLNSDNLCEIIINCGESYLCDICNNHPRFFQWLPGVTECGLGLSCEEVSRLLLTNDFFQLAIDGEEEHNLSSLDKEDLKAYKILFNLRNEIYNILKNNKPYLEKKKELINKIENYSGEKLCLKTDKELIDLYKKTEPISESFTCYINDLSKNLNKVLKIEAVGEDDGYSKILAYIIYRHLVESIYDCSLVERICFALESIRFIEIMDKYTIFKNGEISIDDRIENLKNWSKQIEYSEENTELLIYGEEE